jgi:hypothetical protein
VFKIFAIYFIMLRDSLFFHILGRCDYLDTDNSKIYFYLLSKNIFVQNIAEILHFTVPEYDL